MDSSLSRPIATPQAFASPLAQIYPPLVENILEEQPDWVDGDDVSTNGPLARATGVSSAPFTRKRMLSIQSSLAPALRRGNLDPSVGHSSLDIPRKTSGPAVGEKGRDMPISTSPEQLLDLEEQHEPRVSEVKDAEENAGPINMSGWSKRLEEIERRQARIETLLEQIAARV